MKTSILSSTLIAASLGCTFPALAEIPTTDDHDRASHAAVPAPLMQITVTTIASMRPPLSDDIAEAFAEQVADTLREHGFAAPIHYVAPFEHAATNQPLLAITLVEWQADLAGNVTCAFSATLQTPKGRTELGRFSGVGMGRNPRPDWFLIEDQFEEAERQALSDLHARLADTHLLSP